MTLHGRILARVLLSALATLALRATTADAVDLFDFNGSITDVGVQRGPGQVGGVEFRIRGKFSLDHPLDLARATVVLEHLFVDAAPGGLGELMTTVDDAPVVPLLLVARDSNRAENAVFDQPRSYRPHIRLQIQLRGGAYELRLKLDRGLMRRRPRVCEENLDPSSLPFTEIVHGLIIDDGVNPPVEILTSKLWECTKPGRYHMRSRGDESPVPPTPGGPTPTPRPAPTPTPAQTAGPAPTGTSVAGNAPPTASLRQNQHGLDGPAGLVELDGGDSADRDGVIVRYRFDSGDGRVQDGPEPLARFVYPPGDHRASLVVFDDQGEASKPATRGFSVQ